MLFPVSRFRRWLGLSAVGFISLFFSGWTRLAGNLEGIREEPLAARSGPRGTTLFKILPATETGVVTENRYNDPRIWTERYHEFSVGAVGTGIAIGDYDGDGKPDIFVVSKTESCRLFRNLGDWKFEDVTERAGVADHGDAIREWKQGAAFADVNNDGWLDLYVCRFNAPNLLYINQGDGTFREMAHAYGLDVKDGSVMASFCDYDRDGWLDVYLAVNILDTATHPQGQRGYLFHNNRNGTFTDVTDRAGIGGESQSHSATWWDYDNDGWPDLYVANDFAVPDMLYRNNRDGTFRDVIDAVVPVMPFQAMGADLGDFNNDGLMDFFVADMARTTHEREQQTVADTRAQMRAAPDTPGIAWQTMRNTLYLNTGVGRCLEVAHLAGLAATDWTWAVRAEDLDNDGRLDLYVTNGMVRDYDSADLRARTMKAEDSSERVRIVRSSPVGADRHLAYRNLGDLRFEEISAQWGLDQRGVAFGAAFGDLDGDGDLDLVYANYQGGVSVLRNDSDTGHRLIVALQGSASNRFGVGAVVRIETAAGPQVRQLGLARGYLSTSEPILHFGLGAETQIRKLTVEWPSGAVQVFTELPADRRITISEPRAARTIRPFAARVSEETQFNNVSESCGIMDAARERPFDAGVEPSFAAQRFNRRGPALALGDLDGDGQTDLLIGGTTLDPAHWLHGAGGGRWETRGVLPLPGSGALADGPVVIFDASGNGRGDVLVTKSDDALVAGSSGYRPQLLLNDGHANFIAAPDDALPPLAMSVGAMVVADFNRDGRLDVFMGGRLVPGQYPTTPRSALLMNHGGRFEDVTDEIAPGLSQVGMVAAALWSDVDGDGWLDLLLTLEWGNVRYFHNAGGKRFEDWTDRSGFVSAGTGWWNSIAAADFNGDGRTDYVVGNLGLNTQYQADASHPAVLFSGDFKGDQSTQLIYAYYEGERLYPWVTRRALGAVIPSILKKFPKNDLYARASVEEIFGAEKLASAQRLFATEFRSGVLLSQPNGTYQFEPLPRMAQVAPLQGLVAGDFDGDGNADIYAVQNSYAPITSVGRFDGGLSQFVRGDGHGNFVAVPVVQSGLLVSGDAKALAVVDLDHDGWPDFMVTRNNGTAQAFRNQGVEGRHSLRISLRGLAGNPTGIGARVSVGLSDGRSQMSEVYAGSGYFSQSAADCFFGYAPAQLPLKITVTWPSGAKSERMLTSPTATLEFSEAAP